MLTADAVTPSADIPVTFFAFTLLYLLLSLMVIILLVDSRGKATLHWRAGKNEAETAAGPSPTTAVEP